MAQYLKIMNKRMVLLNPVSEFISSTLTNEYFFFRNLLISRTRKATPRAKMVKSINKCLIKINKKVRKIEEKVDSKKTNNSN